MKNNSSIKYLALSEKSEFACLHIRENPEDAFDNAIQRGMKSPEDWMYMYSENGRDYFKHCDYRTYTSYPQFRIIDAIKNKLRNLIRKCKI